ncbi:gamma-glutamylcyclotransferase [Devosia sp.]|uniref:gamma-glutamylcyclotransferase n=1 Tax=Devosia sp. TaxID=1871048 RepID=UPI003A936E1F
MPPSPAAMRLTEDHVARLVREMVEPGPPPGLVFATDDDYRQYVAEILAGSDGSGQIWVFAYGSLIWKPACDVVEIRTGLLRGWHRAFCLGWNTRHRGSVENPGLMLALDRGGSCKGALYRLPTEKLEECLDKLVRREMGLKPSPFPPRWVNVQSEGGTITALTFCIDRNSGRYVSGLDEPAIADVLATAVGARGSMAEYLYQTVRHLEDLGIHDPHLWRLQEMVAERIETQYQMA